MGSGIFTAAVKRKQRVPDAPPSLRVIRTKFARIARTIYIFILYFIFLLCLLFIRHKNISEHVLSMMYVCYYSILFLNDVI